MGLCLGRKHLNADVAARWRRLPVPAAMLQLARDALAKALPGTPFNAATWPELLRMVLCAGAAPRRPPPTAPAAALRLPNRGTRLGR